MPSTIDQRRLHDGARALAVSAKEAVTVDEVRAQLAVVHDGLAALQSLDDLGPEANARAFADERKLWKRYETLSSRLRQLEGKETSS